MLTSNSIFKTITKNNLIISIIPLCCVLSITCFLVCSNYRSEKSQTAANCADAYAQEIRAALTDASQRSDYILKYNYLIEGLNKQYTNPADILVFYNDVTSYFDTIYSYRTSESVTVYFTNPTLYDGRYFLNIQHLPEAQKVNRFFEESGSSIYKEDNIYTDEHGKEYFLFYRKMPFNNGSLLAARCYLPERSPLTACVSVARSSEIPREDYAVVHTVDDFICAAPIEDNSLMYVFYIFLFLLIGLIFICTIIILAYKTTSKTTTEIESFITRLSTDDVLSMNISQNSLEPFELSVIKRTISNLVMKIKEDADTRYRYELERQDLKMQLLQSRLKPHILYNSLSVIKLKAFRYGDNEIITIINNLVTYYRSVLNNGKENISIYDELILLEKYVSINEISHGRKYNLEFDVPEELKSIQIPHLLLQPFVENSITHGLSGEHSEYKIRITCRRETPYLFFTVYDTGFGLTPEMLEKLNNLQDYEDSYGIKNVYLRIQLIFGKSCGIFYRSEQNRFTEATIKILESPPSGQED